MAKAKRGVSVSFKTIGSNCQDWLSKPAVSFPLETALVTVTGAVGGAASSFIYDTAVKFLHSLFTTPPPAIAYLKGKSGGNWANARNFAVYMGVNTGISSVLKKVRGKEDLQSSMLAALGAGIMLSVVRGKQPADAITCGILFAVLSGGIYKVQEMRSQEEEGFGKK